MSFPTPNHKNQLSGTGTVLSLVNDDTVDLQEWITYLDVLTPVLCMHYIVNNPPCDGVSRQGYVASDNL